MATKFTVEAIFKAVDDITGPIDKMQRKLLGFSKNTREGLANIDRLNSRVSSGLRAVATAAAAAGAAAGAALYNIGKTGSDFEQAITNVGAVSLMTRKDVEDLEIKARELGKTTKFSATEVAAGMELMGKAGFTNAQILQSIDGVLAAAAAEGAEFAEVAGHVSNILKGMGLEASETGRVADVLTLASARTNSSISSLGESLANTSATARQFKIPLEQVTAAVALLQDVGLDASVAGSAVNTMLTNLAKPTDDIKAKMAAMGVKFQDAKGNMLAFPDVLANLAKASKKAGGNMKQVAFFADLVGMRGQKAAQNLADLFVATKANPLGKFTEMANELINKAKGASKEMATLRMDTFQGDLTLLGNQVDALKISLFDLNNGPLRGVVQSMTAWVKANDQLILNEMRDGIAWLVDNLPDIWKWTKRIVTAGLGFYAFATAVKAVHFAVEAYEAAVIGATFATKAWVFGMKGLQLGLLAWDKAIDFLLADLPLAAKELGALRLNSQLGAQINGITSSLGQAGLLGAALGVGVAFGMWLDHTFKLSDKLADLMYQLTGLEEKLAGRDAKRGLQKGANQDLGGGNIRDAAGNLIKMGMPNAGITESEHRKSFFANEEAMSRLHMNAAMKKQFEVTQARYYGDDALARAMREDMGVVSPQERTATSISESTETTKGELIIKDQSGRAELTKTPKGSIGIQLEQTGAFQ